MYRGVSRETSRVAKTAMFHVKHWRLAHVGVHVYSYGGYWCRPYLSEAPLPETSMRITTRITEGTR